MNFQFSLIYYFLTKTSNNKVFDEDKVSVQGDTKGDIVLHLSQRGRINKVFESLENQTCSHYSL